MDLAEATTADAAAGAAELALLPVGSTEQHGPHAPLSTDTLNAVAVAEAGADRYDGDVVVAPGLPYGISEEHRAFAGTLWLAPDTLRAAVREAVESLASHGWNRVVIVNGHGGNTDALREVAAGLTRAGTARVAAFTWFEAVGEHGSRMGHAGPLETAMLRRHHPELVREGRVDDAADGAADRWGDWVSGVNLAVDADEFARNGVVGDPRGGDAELGAELTEFAADALVELLDALAARPVPDDT